MRRITVALLAVYLAGYWKCAELSCPRACDCFPNGVVEGRITLTVDCSGRDLLEIPYPLPNGTNHLDASSNLIQYIRSVDFSPGDTSLRFLQLQNNDLMDIEAGAFQRLANLETLILDNNNNLGVTSHLREGTFNGLDKLLLLSAINTGLKTLPSELFSEFRDIVQIDLRFNQLEEISALDFADLQYLQSISLSNNFILNIESSSFSNLRSLVHLDLSFNQLQSITDRAFVRLPRIRSIDLTGNPIECACCAAYLHSFFTRKRLVSPVCQEPEQLRGMLLLNLNIEDICVVPTAMVFPDETLVIANDTSFSLNCVVTGTPPPEVTWSRDGMTLEADGSGLVITDTTLTISASQATDSGEYHCSASSTAGLVSSSVQVVVLEDTEDTLTEAVVREDVVLDCSSEVVTSDVSVQWMLDNLTLPVVSDKYVLLRNGSLLIVEVWVEDMGDYVCQLGQVQLLRTLNLTASPEIVAINEGSCEAPAQVVVDSDTTTFLTCQVFGIPSPRVQWLFMGTVLLDEVPVDTTGGVVTAALPLATPGLANEGNYTCVGSNEVGNTNRTISVTVRTIIQEGLPSFSGLRRLVGETAVIECPLTESQLAGDVGVDWGTMSGNPLPEGRFEFLCDLNQTLVLQDLMLPEDITTYTCMVDSSMQGFLFLILFVLPTIQVECATPTITALYGEDITLPCLARGNPPVTTVWTRDGEVVDSTVSRVTVLSQGLHVAAVMEADSAIYNCTVVNVIMGEVFMDTYAQRLLVQRPPYFTYRPHSISVVSGNMAVLSCGGRGTPTPTVVWKRVFPSARGDYQGVVLEVESDGRVLISENFLIFSEVALADEGFYFCCISSSLGNLTSNKALLNVYSFPVVTVAQSQVDVVPGVTNVALQCNVSGDPTPAMQWLRLPEMTILPSNGIPNYERSGSDLIVLSASLEDAGVYRCWAANVAGQVSQDITLNVIAPPVVSIEPGDVVAHVGCQVVFTCLDGGQPAEDLVWMFDGVAVELMESVFVRNNGDLVLSNLQLQDAGNYSCTVFGMFQNITTVVTLTVQDPLFPDNTGTYITSPFITSPTPSTLFVSAADTAQFVCVAEGNPPPEVVWFVDGVEVNGSRVDILMGVVLVVDDVMASDGGLYSCLATNSRGTDSRDFILVVTAPPTIVDPPVATEVPVNSILNLTCAAEGEPPPFIWWLLNDTVVMEDRRRFIDADTNTLEIFNTSLSEDSGFYTCVAWNNMGTHQHTVFVQVTDVTTSLSLRFGPESQTLEYGSPLVLDCIIDGHPPPTITWLRDEVLVPTCSSSPSERLCVDDLNFIYQPSAEDEDSGVFTCVGARDAMMITHSADITILPLRSQPLFLLSPASDHVVNDSLVTLDCIAEGSPHPNISWLLNMEPVDLTLDSFEQLENGSLVIVEVDEDTAGFYTCVADNGYGHSEVTVSLILVEDYVITNETAGLSAPVMTSFPLGTLTLFPGHSTVLDCTATGQPPPTTTWTRNSLPIDFSSFPSLSLASNGSLVLSAVTGAEEGNYSCTATNQAGSYQIHFGLDIAGGVSRFSEGVRALSGSHVELTCNGHEGVVMWQHGGRVVHEDQGVMVEGNGSLIISHVLTTHSGKYECLTPTSRGWTDSTMLLTVKPREEPPLFTVEPEDVHVVKRGVVVLPCAATSLGGEHTHIHWLQDTTNISRTRHGVLQDNSLLLTNARVVDSGEYSCVASNQYGRSVSMATLTVSRFKVDEFVNEEEGSSVLLTCDLGEGGDEVQWMKDNKVMSSYNGGVWLRDVNHTHQGEYTCSYKNQMFNYYLTVQAPPRITTPSMIVHVTPGDTVALDCAATGRPHPQVSWYHGELQLETSGRHSILWNGTLLVYEAERGRDGGVYLCQAHNSVGEHTQQNTISFNTY